MLKKIIVILFLLFGISLLVYLAWPAPAFPKPMSDFKVSTEPADQETVLRRGYYTNLDRNQITSYYAQQLKWGFKLNYPPEDAQTLIRDQTHATYLEEVVHPMRESLFITGNEVQPGKAMFTVDGKNYSQKVIIKYNTSNAILRFTIGLLTLGLIWILGSQTVTTVKDYKKWIYR